MKLSDFAKQVIKIMKIKDIDEPFKKCRIEKGAHKCNSEYDLLLPPKPKAENDDFIIYAADSLESLAKDILNEITLRKIEILSFFNLSNYQKVQINLYDNQEKFISFLVQIGYSKELIPEYCKGSFALDMVSLSINVDKLKRENYYLKKVKNASHEFVHIVYKEIVGMAKRVIWLDEGLAQNLSGELDSLNDNDKFKMFLKNKIVNIEIMPNMNQLVHGTSFYNDQYNAYDLSYISVRYLLETKLKEEVQEIIKNYDKTIEIGENVLYNAINYYSLRLNLDLL